jgi:DNA-binding response OmpR family regulator
LAQRFGAQVRCAATDFSRGCPTANFGPASRLRTLSETRAVAVIMTGRTGDRHVVHALAAGADDYLVKPFGIAELIARIRALLRRTRAQLERICVWSGELEMLTPQS